MTPEFEPPAFVYSSGLCYIPHRKAGMVYDHGVGLFYWGRVISAVGIPNIRFAHLNTPYMGERGTDTLECWYSLTSSCGMAENIWRYVLSIRQAHAGESTPGTAYLAIYAAHGLYAALYACHGSPHFISFGFPSVHRTLSLQENHHLLQVPENLFLP
eukprot:2928761-Pleurochrysis_carterae.AAC.3